MEFIIAKSKLVEFEHVTTRKVDLAKNDDPRFYSVYMGIIK